MNYPSKVWTWKRDGFSGDGLRACGIASNCLGMTMVAHSTTCLNGKQLSRPNRPVHAQFSITFACLHFKSCSCIDSFWLILSHYMMIWWHTHTICPDTCKITMMIILLHINLWIWFHMVSFLYVAYIFSSHLFGPWLRWWNTWPRQEYWPWIPSFWWGKYPTIQSYRIERHYAFSTKTQNYVYSTKEKGRLELFHVVFYLHEWFLHCQKLKGCISCASFARDDGKRRSHIRNHSSPQPRLRLIGPQPMIPHRYMWHPCVADMYFAIGCFKKLMLREQDGHLPGLSTVIPSL